MNVVQIIFLMKKQRYDDPAPVSRTYQPTKPLTVLGDPMVIAAPHAKDIEDTHATPSPTPPVAAIASTLQPAAGPKEDLMRKMTNL